MLYQIIFYCVQHTYWHIHALHFCVHKYAVCTDSTSNCVHFFVQKNQHQKFLQISAKKFYGAAIAKQNDCRFHMQCVQVDKSYGLRLKEFSTNTSLCDCSHIKYYLSLIEHIILFLMVAGTTHCTYVTQLQVANTFRKNKN